MVDRYSKYPDGYRGKDGEGVAVMPGSGYGLVRDKNPNVERLQYWRREAVFARALALGFLEIEDARACDAKIDRLDARLFPVGDVRP